MSSKNILVTAPSEMCGNLKLLIDQNPDFFTHTPLEQYEPFIQREESDALKALLHTFTFVVYGSLGNAKYFIRWVKEHEQMDVIQNLVHFVMDKPAAQFLEKNGVPAIMPRENARPIDIMEFMLRVSKEGKTLYPKSKEKAEEMPGLLHELQMPVAEFTVSREKELQSGTLKSHRLKFSDEDPKVILFHNRSSVTRSVTAFPNLNLSEKVIISGSAGVTQMLVDKAIEPGFEAEGSWPSIGELIQKEILS
ncbi:hypothetical protein [Rhodohalobacter sp. SW132]|uniref:hypothetical protein n=1 Tax=Rhodohalobacter sp. SW132 TaxID=2293433 RepID=UPI0011C03137|nr:hypothetical protein [Rhodohalobacter sp. SW132]